MKNIDYLAHGYNMYKGNPLNTESLMDPGFSPSKVYQFTYVNNQLSDDLAFLIPDYLTVQQQKACQMKFKSETITGEQSLSDSLTVGVNFGVEVKDVAAFKASTTYKKMTEEISTQKSVYVSTMGICSVYQVFFNTY